MADKDEDTFHDRPGFWNTLKAKWYKEGLAGSTFPSTVAPFILSHAAGAESFLDVGSGCGSLALPLARAGKKVTALDPAPPMIAILDNDIKKEGLANLKTITATWEAGATEPHDVIICANVPGLLKGRRDFLKEADEAAGKYVFIIESADPGADKFYYKELYPLVFNRKFGPRKDYIATYDALHAMGIFANVRVVEYDFDQPFTSMDEALEFWKEHMCIVTAEHDETLKDFLSKKLVTSNGRLISKIHKKSAIIWWKKEGC
ncbi:MAG: class I SAM-dependent methyltransferase [Thermodesulfobacteriota bacterium]